MFVKYANISAVLVEAIKALYSRLLEVETEVKEMLGYVGELKQLKTDVELIKSHDDISEYNRKVEAVQRDIALLKSQLNTSTKSESTSATHAPESIDSLTVEAHTLAHCNSPASIDFIPATQHSPAVVSASQTTHSCLPPPAEVRTLFKGEGQLECGRSMIVLPEAGKSISSDAEPTVHLTSVGSDRLAILPQQAMQIRNGTFIVYSDNSNSTQWFIWEVKVKHALQ
jgi:hypothetical protein